MLKPYVIRQGDYMSKLGPTLGFNPETAWSDPKNDAIRKKRTSMNMLQPGDIVFLPDDPRPRLPVAGGSTNAYTARIPKVTVKLKLQVGGVVLPKEPYVIRGVGPDPIEGATDDNGVLSAQVKVHVREFEVELTSRKRTLRVRVGDMDPINELTGVQKRLTHLGFYLPTKTGAENYDALDPKQLVSAIRAFQASKNIKVTGKMDEDTKKALVSAAGS